MDVSDISARQRLGIGVALTLFAQVLVVVGSGHIGPDLGPLVRIGGLSVLLGVGFLGAALEPALTSASANQSGTRSPPGSRPSSSSSWRSPPSSSTGP